MDDQLSLFASSVAKDQGSAVQVHVHVQSGPEPVFTLSDVVSDFYQRRQPAVPSCRACGCTEAMPCNLHDGEKCILSARTGYCNKTSCVRERDSRAGGVRGRRAA